MISTEVKKEITVETNHNSNGSHAKDVPPTQTGQEKQRNWFTINRTLRSESRPFRHCLWNKRTA